MMHTSYSTSIFSLTSYSTFNDYSSYYSNETYPSYCSCCCSFPINSCKLLLPTNPNFLYGLRQSTLIHRPPSKRVLLGFNDRFRSRLPVHDVGRCCCFEPGCIKQDRAERVNRNRCEKRNLDLNKVKGKMARPRGSLRVYGVGDVEAMLSLLSEEIVEDCLVLREKKVRSCKGGKVVSKQSVVIEELSDRNEDVGFGYKEKLGKRVQSRNEGYNRKEERCEISKEEDQNLRRREFSSSFYSVSDSGEFGSDIEVEVESEKFVGDSSTSYKEDSSEIRGIVSTKEAKQNWGEYRDDKNQELRSSRRDDRRVGNSIQQNWRKKSEKKLTEESEESRFRNESSFRQSQLSHDKEKSAMISSSSKNQFNFQEEKLNSDLKSQGKSNVRIQEDNRVDEYLRSSIQREDRTQERRENIETTSSSLVDKKSVLESGCEYCKTCGRSMEERKRDESRMNVDAKLTINAEDLSENRHRREEKGSNSLQSSVMEESKQHGQMEMVTGQTNAKKNSQYHLDTTSSSDNRAQSIISQKRSETRMQSIAESSKTYVDSWSESRLGKEENIRHSLETSAKEEKRQHGQISMETGQLDSRRKSQYYSETIDDDDSFRQSNLRSHKQSETRMKELEEKTTTSLSAVEELERLREESSKVSHTEISQLRVHSSDMEINTQSISDKRVYNEQTYSKTKVQSLEELVEKRKRIEETIVQSTLRNEVQGSSSGRISGEAIISQPSEPSISRIAAEKLSGQETESEKLLVTSPIHQELRSSTQIHPQVKRSSSDYEVDYNEKNSGEENSPKDALLSAERMQESATRLISEFVGQARHEASTSETNFEKKVSKLDEKNLLKRSSQLDIDNSGLQDQGSDISSTVSTPDSEKKSSSTPDSLTKGSSDQMYDVKDHFIQETLEMEPSEGATSQTVVSVRTGKSMWNLVADVFRLRWGPRSENQKSPVKKQSPTGSGDGETWFSGDEVDEPNDNGAKSEKIGLLQECTSEKSPIRTTTSQKGDIISDDKLSLVDAGSSSSSSVVHNSSRLGGALVESTDLNIPQSGPSHRQLRRSTAFEEHSEEEKKETPVSSSEERQSDASPSEGETQTDSKRRLQRSKLVLQRFDEWEDAYKREREQRKVDEIFMREALSEAMKAADSWEVPVGAVLVQNGKIIARGFNLVEELRDSTAHAEMICIREASNVLRTWRLSETTLYVTLEPCPMCAGAILQARISTLVWGAPNKLLGADGSWIRLFPEGLEGDERSEVIDKPAAPIHPFHPKMNIRRGILQEECADIMQQFFQLKRRKAKPKATTTISEEPEQPTCFPKPKHKSKLLHKMHNVFHPSNPSAD